MIRHTYLEYQEAISALDLIAELGDINLLTDEQLGQVNYASAKLYGLGFEGEPLDVIDLMGDDIIKCTRCPCDIGQNDRVGNDLVCPGCYNTIPDRELREILSRPKCLQGVPHG